MTSTSGTGKPLKRRGAWRATRRANPNATCVSSLPPAPTAPATRPGSPGWRRKARATPTPRSTPPTPTATATTATRMTRVQRPRQAPRPGGRTQPRPRTADTPRLPGRQRRHWAPLAPSHINMPKTPPTRAARPSTPHRVANPTPPVRAPHVDRLPRHRRRPYHQCSPRPEPRRWRARPHRTAHPPLRRNAATAPTAIPRLHRRYAPERPFPGTPTRRH